MIPNITVSIIAEMTSTIGYQNTIPPIFKNLKSSKLYSILLLNPTEAEGINANNQFTLPILIYINVGINTIIIETTIVVEVSCTIAEMHVDKTVTAIQHTQPVNAKTICNFSRLNDGKEYTVYRT